MADAALKQPPIGRARLTTQQIAWGTVLLAFALFCVLFLISGLALHYFLFESTIPMPTRLTVGRGTTIATEANLELTVVRSSEPYSLENGYNVSTDDVGQAMLTFYDDRAGEQQVIATAILHGNSSVDLRQITRPRFTWSTSGYTVRLTKFDGRMELRILADMPDVNFTIQTEQGAEIRFLEGGRYGITANVAQVRVEPHSGSAELTVGTYERILQAGDRVMYDVNFSEVTNLPPRINLIENNTFNDSNVFASNPTIAPSAWGCYTDANDNALGTFGLANMNGRPVLHFLRASTVAYGETGCATALTSDGRPGIDIRGYQYLSLEALFRIDRQSLSGCGERGSECPLMMRLEYQPAVSNPDPYWIHGFYLWNSNPSYPATCLTCSQEHEIVNTGNWYRYRSENLLNRFALLPPEMQPVRLLALRVYASGHEYDVYLDEVSLFASEGTDPIPVGDPSLQG